MSIEKLIDDVTGRIGIETVAALLRLGLTMQGRIEWQAGLAVLSPAERYACDRVLAQERSPSRCTGNLSIAFRPHGRLYLLPRAEFEAQAEALRLLCHVELDEGDLQKYHALRQSSRQELEKERAEIGADLNTLGFEHVCTELAFAAEHMAPLIYYVGERCISNFYDVGKSGFAPEMTLGGALDLVLERREQADIEALTAVHCLHLALCSGGYTRLEELNSTLLSRPAILEFFENKHSFYQETCGCPAAEGFAAASLRGKAALLARTRETIAARQRFIRLIKGTNLSKKEAVLPLPPATTCDAHVPSANVQATLHRCLPPDSSVRRLFGPEHFEQMLGTILIPEQELSSFDSCLECLVDRIVAEAVRSTNSDFGMSRSVRDYRRFAEALSNRQTAAACGWSQAEYFCHVVPSLRMLKAMSPTELCTTLNAISARMRFNSWHYMPSYFDVADIPANRGWFTAPRMADIADDSDQHHTGHVRTVVRHSIRSPLPLRVGQKVLPGLMDLRLMRQSGDPYGREELMTAISYTEVLQFLYQRLMNYVIEKHASFIFSFGDRKWFDRMYQRQATPALQPDKIAQPLHAAEAAPTLT